MFRVVRTAFMLSALAGAATFTISPALASTTEQFVIHSKYEAMRSHTSIAVDPQVFVADKRAPQGSAVAGIAHAAGYRPARLSDNASLPLYNAEGVGLSLSLGRWLGGAGTAEFLAKQDADGTHVNFTFTGLVPFGLYSVFLNHTGSGGTVVSPLGGSANKITASIDGFARVSTISTTPLENGDELVLVYHSDGETHEGSRGDLGVTAHEQLLLPVVIAKRAEQPTPITTADPIVETEPTTSPSMVTPTPQDSPFADPSGTEPPASTDSSSTVDTASPTPVPEPTDEPSIEPSASPTETPSPSVTDSNDLDDVFVPHSRATAVPTPPAGESVKPDDEPKF